MNYVTKLHLAYHFYECHLYFFKVYNIKLLNYKGIVDFIIYYQIVFNKIFRFINKNKDFKKNFSNTMAKLILF